MSQSANSPIFPADRFAEIREALDYPLEDVPEEKATQENDWFDWLNNIDLDFSETNVQIILGILLVALGVLIYRILDDVNLRRRLRGEEEEEDKIEISDLEEERMVAEGVKQSLLERAESTKQFAVAVRLLYIQLLKELQDGGLIKYRRDYSNRDYQHQLAASSFLEEFRAVTADYERYWYGKYTVDQLSYRLTKQKFTSLSADVRRATTPKNDDYV